MRETVASDVPSARINCASSVDLADVEWCLLAIMRQFSAFHIGFFCSPGVDPPNLAVRRHHLSLTGVPELPDIYLRLPLQVLEVVHPLFQEKTFGKQFAKIC